MSLAAKAIRGYVLKLEALDEERKTLLYDAERSGFDSELIEVVVTCRKFDEEYKQAHINLPQQYLDALKPVTTTAKKLPGL